MQVFSHKTKSKHNKQAVKRKKKEILVKFKSKYFIIGSLLTLLVINVVWLYSIKPAIFPVSAVQVVGELHYVDQQLIKSKVVPIIARGFFALDVSEVKQHLLSIPWIKEARIRKIWPRKLIIQINEHRPSVIWNQRNIISESGVLLQPEFNSANLDLPYLNGPKNKSLQVWQQYILFREILAPIELKITRLELAARGAWRLTLNNGIQVVLGTHEIKSRLQRFAVAYDKNLKQEQKMIEYVDMRYTSGMAVGWKSA